MKITIGEYTFELTSIDPEIDKLFTTIYTKLLSNKIITTELFQGVFNRQNIHLFDRIYQDVAQSDAYFDNYNPIWKLFLVNYEFQKAVLVWEIALLPAIMWERESGKHIHKGLAYYNFGMTIILTNDIDGGFSLIHQSLEEDIQKTGNSNPLPSLALDFVTLQSRRVDTKFLDWMQIQAKFINSFLENYRKIGGFALDFGDFSKKFLCDPNLREPVFLFGHAIARENNILKYENYPITGPFMGQLQTNMLFDIVLVIDATLKNKHAGIKYYGDLINALSVKVGLILLHPHLGDINGAFNASFDGTLSSILNGTFVSTKGYRPSGIESDLAISYGIRNYAAHDVSFSKVISESFARVRQSVLNSLFFIIEREY